MKNKVFVLNYETQNFDNSSISEIVKKTGEDITPENIESLTGYVYFYDKIFIIAQNKKHAYKLFINHNKEQEQCDRYIQGEIQRNSWYLD